MWLLVAALIWLIMAAYARLIDEQSAIGWALALLTALVVFKVLGWIVAPPNRK